LKLKEAATAEVALRRLKGESIAEIADEIVMISDGIRKLRSTRLNEDTLLLLIQSSVGKSRITRSKFLSVKTIKAVIDGIANLETKHLKPKEAKK